MAQYREGRVTVTSNSAVVTGTDTEWLSNVQAGDVFLVRGDEVAYRVASVISDTSLQLSVSYTAPTESNTFYSITRDFTEHLNLPIVRNGDVDAIPLFSDAIVQIDAAIGAGGGSGGGGSSTLVGLSDVTTVGAQVGDQFTLLPDGSFGFVRPLSISLTFDHAPGEGGRIIKSHVGNVVTARRLKVSGGTVVENPDDITINIPPPGEANTLVSAGSAQSNSIALPKSGTILRTAGLRAGTGVTITSEGNDLVLSAVGGTGGGGGLSYTLAPIGSGVSLVAAPSGSELRVRSLLFDSRFTVTDDASGSVSISANKIQAADIEPLQWSSITSGQVLSRNDSGQIVGVPLPSPGISSVSQDSSPSLSGPLDLAGNRIIGLPVSFSVLLEKPKLKSYIICLHAPASMRLDSLVVFAESGETGFRLDIGSVPEDTGEGLPDSPVQGTVSDVSGRQTVSATTPMDVEATQSIILTVTSVSPDAEDVTFTLLGVTTNV